MKIPTKYSSLILGSLAGLAVLVTDVTGNNRLSLRPGEHVCYIGNTLADRMQHHGWLETYLHALHPEHELVFRNLGFAGDEIKTRPRSDNFGSPDEWLSKCKADTVFCFFGYNESFRDEEGLGEFTDELASMIDQMGRQPYNGQAPPRLVVFSPIAHENLRDPNLPDGSANNARLSAYTAAMRKVCVAKQVAFVDLFSMTTRLYSRADRPLTMNGVHLLERGNHTLAKAIVAELWPSARLPDDGELESLRQAVLDRNLYWFSRYRVVDGYNVFGGRSKLAWHGQSNADVMRREMEIFDVMTANRDRRIWALAQGKDLVVKDDNLPAELPVKTNKEGPLAGGAFPYLGAEEAIRKMDVHDGMQINVFASEEQFPRLANPVQMAVDTDSRLWVSVWPSYPHWKPTEPRRDALLILPDEDRDGVADECIVFADELNSITGFEFWGGGVIVAAPPELWFLRDTDGDDRADRKVRILQGLSSADTHHSANAMLIGPDGWLYWSRGVFNVTNMETPTGTYRSTQTGVHRFNPRTFEVEFHFPIGPNPHGHVFDQWGYEFANDGTTGTGSYVNIGKGVANKQFYKMRVRPVGATGLLASSHFPETLQGNFLICNTIGVLGVLQHRFRYDGADITAHEIEPIVVSDDPNFRPVDLEIGGDGALYIADWHNSLIGHMQHNIRDPNRDHTHGRVYRVTCPGRDLLQPVRMKDRPIERVLWSFFAKDNGTRYRARLELSGRDTADVVNGVLAFCKQLKRANDGDVQAMLECLWVLEDHRSPQIGVLFPLLHAREPRIRAAATRTLGHWHDQRDAWPHLLFAASDRSPLVRAEAIKAAVEFGGPMAARAVFRAAVGELDPELERLVAYAREQLQLDQHLDALLSEQQRMDRDALAFMLRYSSPQQLAKLPPSESVDWAILTHRDSQPEQLRRALTDLVQRRGKPAATLLLESIAATNHVESITRLSRLLGEQSPDEMQEVLPQIQALANAGQTSDVRSAGYAAWVAASGPDVVLATAHGSKQQMFRFLQAVPTFRTQDQRDLYPQIESLLTETSEHAGNEPQPGIKTDYFATSPGGAVLATLANLTPDSTFVSRTISTFHPDGIDADRFALRFEGQIRVPTNGPYTFFTRSDDGSRLYIDGELVVNNDQIQSATERKGTVDLLAGMHPIQVTFFDNGGASSLSVSWSGPGLKKQPLPPEVLFQPGGESLEQAAIRALLSIPGHEQRKFATLAQSLRRSKRPATAIEALATLPTDVGSRDESRQLVRDLMAYVRALPAAGRTGNTAEAAFRLADSLTRTLLPEEARQITSELAELQVRVIEISTVPHRMLFDKERIVVEAGRPVALRISNADAMPHNLAIVSPGALAEIGMLAEATGRGQDALDRHYVPDSDKVLTASRLLHPGERQTIVFVPPKQPDIYPYVCTYPGHWRRMFGALVVVPDLTGYEADPANYLAAHAIEPQDPLLKRTHQSHAWTFDELIADIQTLESGRSYEAGKGAFTMATCVGCHQLGGSGHALGPDLAKLEGDKHRPVYILQSLLNPSERIDKEFQPYTFHVSSGQVISGIVLEESDESIKVGVGPLVTDDLCGDSAFVLPRDEIDEQLTSNTSLMPEGLLDRLTRDEIIDLIAYVYARGDAAHELFAER